jgi:NADH-quinone oxidoreductase subunit L
MIFALVSSFIIILFTYEFIGMALEHFLYGSDALLFYKAATLNVNIIMTLVMLAVIMLIGWLFMYKQHFVDVPKAGNKPDRLKWLFYNFLAKEGYFFSIVKFFKKDNG